jgi:hypothetical protein
MPRLQQSHGAELPPLQRGPVTRPLLGPHQRSGDYHSSPAPNPLPPCAKTSLTTASLPRWTSERPSSEVVQSRFLRRDGSVGAIWSWSLSWSPISPRLVKRKNSRRRFFPSWAECLIPPIAVTIARGTHPGLHWLGYRAPRARTSHPSGSRLSERSARIRSRPLALESPRKPSVPDRVQLAGRRPQSG